MRRIFAAAVVAVCTLLGAVGSVVDAAEVERPVPAASAGCWASRGSNYAYGRCSSGSYRTAVKCYYPAFGQSSWRTSPVHPRWVNGVWSYTTLVYCLSGGRAVDAYTYNV